MLYVLLWSAAILQLRMKVGIVGLLCFLSGSVMRLQRAIHHRQN